MQNISEAKVKKYSIVSYGLGSAFIMLSGLVIGLWIVLGPRFNEIFTAKDTDSLSGGIFYSAVVCTGLWVLLLVLLVFFVIYYNKISRSFQNQDFEMPDMRKDPGQQQNPNPVVVNINNPNPLLNNNRPNNGPGPNLGPMNQQRPMPNGPQGPRPLLNGNPQGPRPMPNGPQGPRPMGPQPQPGFRPAPQLSSPRPMGPSPQGPRPMPNGPQGPRPMGPPMGPQRPPVPPRPGNR
ncbi:hypothetical protein [Malacoplasma iowae]|uniref:PvpA C-terminal repeat-like domain-containing protein n=1 Tax=Malacoplasma iowae DK-CPA TaxID=1394179 RepID=A0A084U4G7_MALIO|nr:hypothetical protein [Malacoplasma iowae]KFB07853.1 PvpA C-terminal repeat-like domain-containing protein [Malacoplasma iowae DK-CPA]WPL36617.1 hypothetical protein QX179_04295 [Malacoplasma iowae]WPL41235.1 hypothetical protein QX184_01365 [Malacoplasma iowae]